MLYLLDANVLITANSTYYAIDQVPEFWSWLHHQGTLGLVKLPREIMEEVKGRPRLIRAGLMRNGELSQLLPDGTLPP